MSEMRQFLNSRGRPSMSGVGRFRKCRTLSSDRLQQWRHAWCTAELGSTEDLPGYINQLSRFRCLVWWSRHSV